MMYDHEKSDPAIVAVKPTNKAGEPAAELVEPRAGTERNAGEQSTGRAQYRGTVSQALKRMRNFVRQSRRAVTHPRWEPCARIGLVRICAGARGNSRPLYVADCLANTHLPSSEENGEPLASLRRISLRGRLGPVFQALGRK
jgi:hypothetical protein